MSNVVQFPGQTILDTDAARVMDEAILAGLKTAIVIGYTDDGEEYFAATTSDVGTLTILLQRMNYGLLNGQFGELS